MLIIIPWILFAAIVGFVASSRGHSGSGFFLLSLVLSPLVGFLFAALLPAKGGNSATQLALPGPSTEFRTKWPDLVRYDPDINAAVAHLSQYGDEAVFRFRDAYSALNDKNAIPTIVADIDAHARSIKNRKGWMPGGYRRVLVRRGVPIYKSGSAFWVAGEHFTTSADAQAYANKIAKDYASSKR